MDTGYTEFLELTTKAVITHAISIVLVNIVIWPLGTLSNCEVNLILFALIDPRTVHFHFCEVTCFQLRLSFIRPKSNSVKRRPVSAKNTRVYQRKGQLERTLEISTIQLDNSINSVKAP